MATIKDVAKLAGVAVSTASIALNGKDKVSEETKQKVLDAAKQLNYQKHGAAMDLKRSSTKTIALILNDLSGPFYSELIKGVQEVTIANGYDLIACSSLGGPESTAVKFLKEKRVDGVIILASNVSDDIIKSSQREKFPIVLLDRYLDGEELLTVQVDNEQGGYLATEHLLNLGHKKVAFISGSNYSYDNKKRFEGYKRALMEHGISYETKWNISGNFTREGGYSATRTLIAQGDLPTAIFYANDEMAIGGLKAFEEKGINVPGDVSVVGFDDIQIAEYVTPGLTTVRQPKYEMGTLAAHILFQSLIEQQMNEKYYKLSTEIIIRKSCGVPSKTTP
ncbi:LacI family DNA-binding transcriptional regulator [Anaerobacillus sp. CMMVII]|uniref:LacI family DNA-binding transcriptional regulator n=1 Tax=Anaerobacillus sp. CMMVII TaxID=2755588 RepID=UPI0021B6F639|nr:LacI family DNA-binding transcriptional regulator [Anaerobacillus sp. CMMVII]MCT8137579.1 LacI family DNA-binding transcriptional regulator [Anaerobacillus sp. CMMVII]